MNRQAEANIENREANTIRSSPELRNFAPLLMLTMNARMQQTGKKSVGTTIDASGKTNFHTSTYQFTRPLQVELAATVYILVLQLWARSSVPILLL